MVFLSLAFFLRKRFFWGFVFAGAAMSFHVLIGIYALFCIGVAFILNKTWRNDWLLVLKNSWPVLITGIFGWWAVVGQLLPQKGVNLVQAWLIYVEYRVPQHVFPKAWSPQGNPWRAELALAAFLFLIMYFLSNSTKGRFIAAFSLGSVFLFLVGLFIYYVLGNTPLLRFYWFRFPDVMVPFMSLLLIALFLNDFADKRITKDSLFQRIQLKIQTIFRLLPPIIIVVLIIMMVQQTNRFLSSYHASLHPNPPAILATLNWISRNTPKQAIFLVDPSESDFYIYAQRAMLVSWKSSPESGSEILEWYKRIKLCNGNVDLENRGYNAPQELHSNFYKLNASQVQQIANLYGINYFLGLATQNFPFERVYSDSTYAIFKIK
jgi:hypothetical protein